ncbi:MAG TPA: hypothetical protein VH120_18380, partial [Gemmataceae bacterium]|nr:hypothetical protein [Gemmataceae bacterium]
TAEEERSPVFAPDGESILLTSDTGGCNIWRAEKADKGKYWFQNNHFKLTKVTSDGAHKQNVTLSPDGKTIAFLKNRGDLWVMDAEGKNARQLLGSFSAIEYDWSPDGKWMVVSMEDSDYNRDIHIIPIDGSRPPFNLSRSPDNDHNPVWSPDGKVIAYVGKHDGTEVDIHYVWLREEDDQTSGRDRSIEKALEKINKVRKPPAGGPRNQGLGVRGQAAPDAPPTPGPRPVTPAPVAIDFDRLAERVKVFGIPQSDESNLFWSPDGKKLAFTGTVNGTRATYYIEFPDLGAPKQLSTQIGTQSRWLKQPNQVVWLSNGVPAAFTPSAGGGTSTPTGGLAAMLGGRGGRGGRPGAPPATPTPTPAPMATPAADGEPQTGGGYAFRALQEVDVPKKNAAVFDLAWRTMRDNYYDDRLGNRDWNAIRAKYIDVAAQCPDSDSVATVIQLMLGELNGSHLGFTPTGGGAAGGPPGRRGRGAPAGAEPTTGPWRDETAHLGVRFDPLYHGPGLKVRDVIPEGPADHKKSRILAGETVIAIDGTPVNPDSDLTTVLNGQPNREIAVKVKAA